MTNQTDSTGSQPATKTLQVPGNVFVIVVVVLAVVISVVAAYTRFQLGPDKENYVVRSLFSIVEHYVESHDGQWPSSWEDLEQLPETGEWYEPMNFELAREVAEIDFDADVNELAQQSPSQFKAIRPKRPVLDYRSDPRVTSLLETIRRSNEKQTDVSN